jgi:Fe-S cluster assembly iron-binding protein IscA
MIKITDAAKDKLKEKLTGHPGKYLRIMTQGFGWGGPKLGLTLDESKENEKPQQINGMDVLVDDFAAAVAGDSTVEWVESPYGGYFTITPDSGIGC